MTDHEKRLEAFVKLGEMFRCFCAFASDGNEYTNNGNGFNVRFLDIVVRAGHHNGWFTKENILYNLQHWAILLTRESLKKWMSGYPSNDLEKKQVAIVMAGNIPLVGFHDFLATLITGNKVVVKLSSNDKILMPFIAEYLIGLEPLFGDDIQFADGLLTDFDMVIATGSNNTARYFEYYFGKKPNVIRKNRNSIAILTGKETPEQLEALGEDLFRYFGLGCRSVSKLFVPRGYDFDGFFKAIYGHNAIIHHAKYANNYDYNKAVYLMGNIKLLDNGFLLLKEDKGFASPIATLFYGYYDSMDNLLASLNKNKDQVQCIVAHGVTGGEIDFGQTQKPGLRDYADDVDTIEFLLRTVKKI